MKIGYIGSSQISDFHIPALQNNGFKISAIGTTQNSLRSRELALKHNLENSYCKGGWNEVINKDLDSFIICVDVNYTSKILEKVLDKGKPIFVEKPIGYKIKPLEDLQKHPNINNVFVGYNRRFYRTAKELKKFCDSSEGGTISINIPDSITGIKHFISNACHIIDLLRFCIGDFKILKKVNKLSKKKDDIISTSALCSNEKWNILINAHSLIPSNFSITVNSNRNVAELKPIEKFCLYEGLTIEEPTKEEPIRRFIPNLKYSLVENSFFKPGFDLMYKNFNNFANNKKCDYCSFTDALVTLKYCWSLIESDLAENFIFSN